MAATKGLTDHLFMAGCEWFLMFWMFIDAALAYSLTRFAKKCQLQIPCLLCSRLDHFFGNEEHGSYLHLHLFCNKHQMDLSYLIYCNLHNELVDAREMCENCFSSVTLQRESNFDCYRFGVRAKGKQLNKNLVGVSCSCCKSHWNEKSIGQRSIQPNVAGSRTSSKVTTKPPLPRVGRHGRSKRMRNKMRNRQRDASFPIDYPELKFTSDSEFEFLFTDDDDDRNFRVMGVSERNSKDGTNNGIRYKILGRRTNSTPDLGSAFLVNAKNNRNSRTRTRARSASLTPNFLTSHNLAELNRRNAENDSLKAKGPLSSMNSTRLWIDSLNKTTGRGSLDGSMASCSNGSQSRYNVFSRNSFSASDLGSALLLEAHCTNSLPRRSASLTPNCYNRHDLGDLNRKESEFLKGKKGKKPLSSTNSTCISTTLPSTDGYGSLNSSMIACSSGSQNRYKIFSPNSFSATDLGSAVLLEMHNNRSLPRRSASLTPNSSSGYHLGEHKKSIRRVPLKPKKKQILGSSSNVRSSGPPSYGYLDDSVISRNKGNRQKIPRRHSCSVFHLGGDILLNMPNDESLTMFLAPNGTPNSSINRLGSLSDFRSDFSTAYIDKSKEYGFLDDSVLSHTTDMQYQNNIPRRHSYSFFDLGCEILLNMPFNKSVTTHSTSFAPNGSNGFSFQEPKKFNFQNRPSPSLNVVQFPRRKAKRGKKSRQSLNRTSGYELFDDLFVSCNTGSHYQENNPRRHSYSAFELGCELQQNLPPFDENLTNNSVSYHSPEIHSHNKHIPPRSSIRTFCSSSYVINDLTRSMDDSVVSCRTGNHIHYQNQIPRRHSYSVFQLGGDILLNMPVDEILTSRSTANDFSFHSLGDSQRSHFQKGKKDKNSLPPTSSIKRFSPPSSDLSIDKTKWHGSFDDYLISRGTSSKIQNNNPRRHSYSAFDMGRALLVEIHLDNSLKNSPASFVPSGSTGHSSGQHNRAHHHHYKLRRDNKALPPPCPINGPGSWSHARHDHFTISSNKTLGGRSLDDFVVSHKTGSHSHNQNNNPRRHSYSAFELECALSLNMQRDASSKRRSASVTPKIQTFPNVSRSLDTGSLNSMQFGKPKAKESQHLISKKDEHSLVSMNTLISDLSSTSLYKPHGYGSYDDSFLSQTKDSLKQNTNLRSYHSASDLTSPFVLQMNLDENLTSGSTSLTPNVSNDQGLGELHLLKFETGTSSSLQKRKTGHRPKGIKNKKPLLTTNNVDKTDKYESFEISNDMGSQSRYKIFSRNSQSSSDLGSVLLLEMHHDESSRSRSKSLTPDCYFRSPGTDSLNVTQFSVREPQENDPSEVEKDKKLTKEVNSPNSIKSDLCPACLDKIDLRSLAGSSVSEIDYEGLEKVKRKVEADVRCMRLLQSELEAERNAATVAANHAMNMITRLQQEKASLQMEALQYLRMMEEQAEYDMEALQKSNELVEEKENEIQDLLDELEQYRIKYGDEATNSIKSLEDEKIYILESLTILEKKIHQLCNGVKNEEMVQSEHLKDENNLSATKDLSSSKGIHEKSQESDNHVDSGKNLATLEHEISDLKGKMEALQADLDLLKHACNMLRGSEGLEFIQEIAHQLQDLRGKMFDGTYVSSN